MALKFDVDAKRGDLYRFFPNDLKMDPELRGRRNPPSEATIKDMALSLIENGQQETLQGRRMPDTTVFITLGYTRTAAGRLIRAGFTDNNGEVHAPDLEFRLQVVLVAVNDKQAFINNIIENNHRTDCSVIDDAHNQERLRQNHGMTNAEIARLYRQGHTQTIVRNEKLLFLSDEIQDKIDDGRMTIQSALDYLLLNKEVCDPEAVLADATDDSGKVNGPKLRGLVRENSQDVEDELEDELEDPSEDEENSDLQSHHLEDEGANKDNHQNRTPPPKRGGPGYNPENSGGETPEKTPKKKAPKKKASGPNIKRSMAEVRKYLTSVKEDSDQAPVQKFCGTLLGFVEGTKSAKQMDNALKSLLDAEAVVDAF